MSQKTIGIFLFRKDFRIHDNLALYSLFQKCSAVIPIFIFDPSQVKESNSNKQYRSNSAIQFMCESLLDLYNQTQKKLIFLYGSPENVIYTIIQQLKTKYDSIYLAMNLDYTKYALERDTAIKKVCDSHKVSLIVNDHDHTLISFERMIKKDNTAYLVYNAFYENAKKTKVATPITLKKYSFITFPFKQIKILLTTQLKSLYTENKYLLQRGGRNTALKKLNNPSVYKNYENKRDLLNFHTFEISAYLNFGCISVREFYMKMKSNITITKQIYWRDFYHCILRYTPYANQYNRCINKDYEKIKWNPNKKEWESLIGSKTGFLMIDAGMRELIKTGYIGNRMRLILGSFWIKYLLIHPLDPVYGSAVGYSRYLVDCNASQNKLNHQWLLEIDRYRFAPKEYRLSGRPFRIDNEMIKKYDKDCEYIKKWIPELKKIPNQDLYKWDTDMYEKYKIHTYPIFNWKERYKMWMASTKGL